MTGKFKKASAGVAALLLSVPAFAYNLQQLSGKDGMSNSAIQAIVQDKERLMWFGSLQTSAKGALRNTFCALS